MWTIVGLVVVSSAVVAYLVFAFTFRRTFPTWAVDSGVTGGLAFAVLDAVTTPPGPVLGATALLAVAWFVLSRLELGLPSGGLRVGVGDEVPPFSLTTTSGETMTESEIVASAPALLVFFRGWWCPYCITQLSDLKSHHHRLIESGLSLYAVSVDHPEELKPLEDRLEGDITFLSDRDGQLLDAVGVRHRDGAAWYDRVLLGAKHRDVSMPATLVVDRNGRVVYLYRSRRIDDRPSATTVLAAMADRR